MRVVMGALEDSGERMKEQLHQLSIEIEEIESVLRNMASFQGMDETVKELSRCLDRIREDELVFYQMLTGLDRILEQYMGCEKKILRLYDQDVYTVRHREVGIRAIQENSNLIKGFIR